MTDQKREASDPLETREVPERETTGRPRLASTAHAVSLTQSWKPSVTRRQSWAAEDRKHESHMGVMGGGHLPEGYSQVSEERTGKV